MSFISYAQNFEDVMLWRALKHIAPGFYIDVGANDPDLDSVTKAFYELGWRGINVEPVPQWFERLEKARPRDINLQLALGAEPGAITLYEIPDTGLTTVEKKFAERHEAERGYQIRELPVQVDTLSRVCERYHLAPIHFLKVDVEGAEMAVFQGTDFGKVRPWIIVVEATLPNSQEESYSDWEPILLSAGYDYVYFDGLNRYYIAGEHENLKMAFKAPPNVFDDFVRRDRLEAELRAQESGAKVKEVEQLAIQAEARAREAETEARQAEARAQQSDVKAWQAEASAQRSQQQASEAEARAEEAEAKAQQSEAKARQAEAKAQQAELNVQLAKASARQVKQLADRAEARAKESEAILQELLSSRSWRVTAPLRWLVGTERLLREKAKRLLKRLLAPLMGRSIRFVKSRPWLKNLALSWLGKYPRLTSRLRRFAAARGLNGASFHMTPDWPSQEPSMTIPQEFMGLSPRTREIYSQLKAAIEKNQESK